MPLDQTRNKVHDFLRSPITLLDDRRDRLFLITFCGIFATFFMFFYQPLNINHWHHDSDLGNFLTIWSAGLIGAIGIGITQFIMRPRFNLTTFTVGQFLLWVLFEFFLLAILMFFFIWGK